VVPELLLLARPWANFFRPYRALRGSSGFVPLRFCENVQTPALPPLTGEGVRGYGQRNPDSYAPFNN
jgi:hypothetical protein